MIDEKTILIGSRDELIEHMNSISIPTTGFSFEQQLNNFVDISQTDVSALVGRFVYVAKSKTLNDHEVELCVSNVFACVR